MRSIHRSAIAAVVAVALVASLVLIPGAAGAAKSKSKGTSIGKLTKRVTTISRNLNKLTVNVHNLQGTVNQGIPIITQLVNGLQQASGGLTALQAALTTAGNGLKALQTAVQDPTTGLPGLNAARNLVGAVVTNAAASGSEFTLAGHATGLLGGAEGEYVLSFKDGLGNAADVSKRVYEVTSANPLQVATTFSATNCSNAAVTALCTGTVGGADAKPTDVLVVTSANDRDFQIAALAG
jgi:uncharacterized phage infection (PIP) family protein YhgE